MEDKNPTPIYEENLELKTEGRGNFTIDVEKLEEMFDVYPLKLSANVLLKKDTEISIPRETKVNVNLEIGMKTNGTIALTK